MQLQGSDAREAVEGLLKYPSKLSDGAAEVKLTELNMSLRIYWVWG